MSMSTVHVHVQIRVPVAALPASRSVCASHASTALMIHAGSSRRKGDGGRRRETRETRETEGDEGDGGRRRDTEGDKGDKGDKGN